MKVMLENLKVGFICFGEVNTPYDIIERKYHSARKKLEDAGLLLVTTLPVTDNPMKDDVERAVREMKSSSPDVLIVCLAGWIPSHAVIDVIEPFKQLPMILLGLNGWQEGNRTVTTADQAGTTALRHPMQEMGYIFKYIVTRLGEGLPVQEIINFLRAVYAVRQLKGAKIGSMGYRDMRLYATLYDGLSLKKNYGVEIDCFEMLEMTESMEKQEPETVSAVKDSMRKKWKFTQEPQDITLEKTARLYLAVAAKIKKSQYQAITLIDVDGVKKFLQFAPAGVFMLLGEELHIPSIPENDFMGSFTQLIVHYLTGQIAAYLEFYEFTRDGAIMGVPDYIPTAITAGDVTITPTAFGDFGEGLLNVSTLKTGDITLLRMAVIDGRYCLHMVQAAGQAPPAWEEAGWKQPAPQLPGLYVKFKGDTEAFIQQVLGQHYIVAYGDISPLVKAFCFLTKTTLIEG
jgi:L-fucose isomerase-like protein